MAICILVLKEEKTAYEFWEKLKPDSTPITNFQVIEPSNNQSLTPVSSISSQSKDLPKKVQLTDVRLLNPQLSRKDRQKTMSLWLMPFGFIAGLTFSQMTGLETFSGIGLGEIGEPIIGSILGMGSGWIGSYTAAASVGSENEDEIKGLRRRNQEGFWLLILETPPEIDLPWQFIKNISPLETVRMSEQ